ncbi:MAG: hypothetical protein QNJ98_20310 [Planctomycetota bacterium]|nr:hypothetical protein [Planctomycetota bacterium]
MSKSPILLALFMALTLGGCGDGQQGGASDGTGRPAPTGDLEARDDALEIPTLEGKQRIGYAIDLPAAYARFGDPGRHLWQVKGTSGRIAPRVRVWSAKVPSLEDARARAAKGVEGEREVLLAEETDTHMLVVARTRADGKWTQVEGWVKGEGYRPYGVIELDRVDADGPQVAWAKKVLASLRGVAAAE